MNLHEVLQKQRDFFDSDITLSVQFRLQKLKKLKQEIIKNQDKILDALNKDLGKSAFEGYTCEIGLTLTEISHTISHLKKWTKPKKARMPIVHFPSSGRIMYQPYGVALVISPWNYPFLLSLEPLIGAVAAGNCVVFKPSACSQNTSKVLIQILTAVFDPHHVYVADSGRERHQELLSQKYDYIFFTGSTEAGRTVMEAAAKNLTPVTLELGGKSPCIVDETANIKLAAKRIIWGKLLNCGQTCVAPDYIYVHKSQKDSLIKYMKEYIQSFYTAQPLLCEYYPKIINQKHFDRLNNLLENQNIVCGGASDQAALKIEPTIIDNVDWDNPLLQQEIFGPILPILTYESFSDIISLLKTKEKPLALYLFSNSKTNQKIMLNQLSFGGGCINDTVVHLATSNLPFGGVGGSGIGQYHGKFSFFTFSHPKSVLKKSTKLDIFLRYPPNNHRLGFIKKLMK